MNKPRDDNYYPQLWNSDNQWGPEESLEEKVLRLESNLIATRDALIKTQNILIDLQRRVMELQK